MAACLRIFLVLILATPVWAAKVKSVKGKKVIVDLEGESVQEGQVFAVQNNAGKTVGLIKLTKIKNNQGLGVLGKGKAEPGMAVKPRQKKSSSTASTSGTSESKGSSGSTKKSFIGAQVGFAMATAKVKLYDTGGNYTETVNLDGNGFSAKGLFDYAILDSIWFRGAGGLEQFVVGGKTDANGVCGGECKAEINYLALDLLARWVMSKGSFRPWLGGGASLMFPISKESTALRESSITNTNVFIGAFGFDYFASESTVIPIQFEYNMYPSSKEVNASAMAIRLGFARPF